MSESDDIAVTAHNATAVQVTNHGHAITVKVLRELLSTYPDDAIVVQSKDSEGNRFSPFAEGGLYWYRPDSTWSGEIHGLEPDDGAEEDDDAEEDDIYEPDGQELYAVVLWPVN